MENARAYSGGMMQGKEPTELELNAKNAQQKENVDEKNGENSKTQLLGREKANGCFRQTYRL